MKKSLLIFPLFLIFSFCYSQKVFKNHLSNIEGIWIEQSFKEYFDSIPSMLQYAKSLNHRNNDISIYPIGLRIQAKEEQNGALSVGYGVLHGHLLYPEVSKFCIQNEDTIYEQGRFKIKLNQEDSLGFYPIPELSEEFAINSKWFIKINYEDDTTITIFKTATEHTPEAILSYVNISSTFHKRYPYPNPKEYYVRQKTLTGTYILKDSLGEKVSSNFIINKNGSIKGYSQWKNQKIEFVTDVFCGGPPTFDKALIYDPNNLRQVNSKLYIYERIDENTIHFFNYKVINSNLQIGQPAYFLNKK